MGALKIRMAFAAIVTAAMLLAAPDAHAANGAYQVDAADISEVGACKLESWISSATNTDFSAVANPSCVVDITRPVELSTQINRFRSDGEWGTSFAPKFKTNIEPTGIGKLGYSLSGSAAFDAASGDNIAIFAGIPATWRLSETMRFNFNGGWFWDRMVDRHYLTYGVGFDWKFTDVLQLTLEMFGQAGAVDVPSQAWPRFQAGVRYRPNEIFSVDLIYGRNITGENSNWITLGTTVRFPAPESKPASARSGHL